MSKAADVPCAVQSSNDASATCKVQHAIGAQREMVPYKVDADVLTLRSACDLHGLTNCILTADNEIYAGEELKVVDSDQYDADDLGSLFGSPSSSSRHETGFLGTALMGAQLVQMNAQ